MPREKLKTHMINVKKLDSKLTLISQQMPSTEAITVFILAKTGSRNEHHKIRGLAHFQEHMFFKGGIRYETAKDVSLAIDSVGGTFNAFTAKEYVGYYVKVDRSQIEKAIDLLSDMLLNSKFDEKEIEKERGVILEEYAMYQDTPMYQVGWDFEELLFGDAPLGWDQIGLPETIKSINRDDFLYFHNVWYVPSNLALCVTGSFDEDNLNRLVNKYFVFNNDKQVPNTTPFTRPEYPKRIQVTNKKTEQSHLVLGTYGSSYTDNDSWATTILAVTLGGNMSSRLFTKIREEKGYAYYVKTASDHFSDTGSFYTRSGVNINKTAEVVKIIQDEYNIIKTQGITEDELVHAKEFIKGQMTLSHEDSEHVANSAGRRYFFEGRILDLDERKREIDKVTLDEVNASAKKIFDEKLFLSIIGPHSEEEFVHLI